MTKIAGMTASARTHSPGGRFQNTPCPGAKVVALPRVAVSSPLRLECGSMGYELKPRQGGVQLVFGPPLQPKGEDYMGLAKSVEAAVNAL